MRRFANHSGHKMVGFQNIWGSSPGAWCLLLLLVTWFDTRYEGLPLKGGGGKSYHNATLWCTFPPCPRWVGSGSLSRSNNWGTSPIALVLWACSEPWESLPVSEMGIFPEYLQGIGSNGAVGVSPGRKGGDLPRLYYTRYTEVVAAVVRPAWLLLLSAYMYSP